MNSARLLKMLLIAAWFAGSVWILSDATSERVSARTFENPAIEKFDSQNSSQNSAQDYVGSEACQACHEVQSKSFSHTAHSRAFPNLKGREWGCETCHGPAKAHVEGGGDKTKIRTFENETAKQISETCLGCHA